MRRLTGIIISGLSTVVVLCGSNSTVARAGGLPAVVAADRIHVGPNVQVSAQNANMRHGEVLFDADPNNPDHLMGCSIVLDAKPGYMESVVYTSSDGGRHWREALRPDLGPGGGDPTCVFGLHDQAYFAEFGPSDVAGSEEHGTIAVYRSPNGGVSWSRPTILPTMDREYLTVDNSSSKYRGRVYLHATFYPHTIDSGSSGDQEINGVGFFVSKDGGATFGFPTHLADTDHHYVLGMGNGVVAPNGDYTVIFGDLPDENTGWSLIPGKATAVLKTVTSKDGGASFTSSKIDDWEYCDIARASDLPYLAADRSASAFRGRLYAAWPDHKSGRCRVMIASSRDNGATWSTPIAIDDAWTWPDGSGPDNASPVVAVNKNGVVGVMWYDRRDNPGNVGYRVRFAASYDGGVTFTSSVPVSTVPVSFAREQQALDIQASGGNDEVHYVRDKQFLHANVGLDDFSFSGGHTDGMAAGADGVFHPFWIDNRTGIQQAWSAAVRVEGVATNNSVSALAKLHDHSADVSLQLIDPSFDSRTHLATATAELLNTSHKPLRLPLIARVTQLSSTLGFATIVNADNGGSGSGALWEFSGADGATTLAPGKATMARALRFRVEHLRALHPPLPDGPESERSFVNFHAIILSD